jgi:hypothetical protein
VSKLRASETRNTLGDALSDDTALYLIAQAVAKRRGLIYGRLHDQKGHHCAMGCFWNDNPKSTVHSALVDEVAAVNDSIPPTATNFERWKKVNEWLKWKLKVLAGGK